MQQQTVTTTAAVFLLAAIVVGVGIAWHTGRRLPGGVRRADLILQTILLVLGGGWTITLILDVPTPTWMRLAAGATLAAAILAHIVRATLLIRQGRADIARITAAWDADLARRHRADVERITARQDAEQDPHHDPPPR